MSMLSLLLVLVLAAPGSEPAKKTPEASPIKLVDAAGKEHLLKGIEFVEGTRRLGWLASPPPPGEKTPSRGPLALVVRDEMKFNFLAGSVTLVPLDRLRAIEFDSEKATMKVQVATGPGKDDLGTLSGTTAYKGINKLRFEAEVDRGEAGIATVVYRGGSPDGIRSLRFPEAKVEAFKPGRPAVVITNDKGIRRVLKVHDLQPLYLGESGLETLSPTLHFRKTLKLDVAKIKSLELSPDDSDDLIWTVTPKEGEASALTLLTSATLGDKKATLVGLVGRVPEGYRLIPVRRIQKVLFDTSEEPASPAKDSEEKADR
ncbi:MAG: hypothetical protein U0840_07285 [Gemmataceae bacterium]